MNITRVRAKEIFDSRGYPTIACSISLENGTTVEASVPSGASCGDFEAFELYDKDGTGVQKAVQVIESIIAPILIGREPDTALMDAILLDLDGTEQKTKLGANTLLAVSIAVCKAQAVMYECEVFELIAELCNAETVLLPFPLINILNGGLHSNSGYPLQEILLVPVGAPNFKTSFEQGITVFRALNSLLIKNKKFAGIGDEGGLSAQFSNFYEPFDFVMEALKETGLNEVFVIGLDAAANQFYNKNTKKYSLFGEEKSAEDLLGIYKKLADSYPLFSIEDGFAETDIEGWKSLSSDLGKTLQIVGDDLFVTHQNKILYGLQNGLANSVIIKPNQIGTVTETLQAMALTQELGANIIVSHRSGETNDTFIADLAVGTSAGQVKIGGCTRGERIAKYNRLIEIEDNLTMYLLDQAE